MSRAAGVTDKQKLARETFDLDAALAALPPGRPAGQRSASSKGQAGLRLQPHVVATISDDLLVEFAQGTLAAKRCSEQYRRALRVVLGNQGEAERDGYVLEMNLRVDFATERVMRTIIDQMRAASISRDSVVGLGAGRCQVVQCFGDGAQHRWMGDWISRAIALAELERINRKAEAVNDTRMLGISSDGFISEPCREVLMHVTITESEVPH